MLSILPMSAEFAVGRQPRGLEYLELAQAGYRSVIDLQPAPFDGPDLTAEAEADLVRSIGLCYYPLPVDLRHVCTGHVDRFRDLLQTAPRAVYVHCLDGSCASAFVLMHLAASEHWDIGRALEEAGCRGIDCQNPGLLQLMSYYLEHRAQRSVHRV